MDKYGYSPSYPYGYPPSNRPYPSHSQSPPNQPYPSNSLAHPNQPYPSHSPPPPNPPYPSNSQPPPNQPYPSHSQPHPSQPYPSNSSAPPNQPYPSHSQPPSNQPYPSNSSAPPIQLYPSHSPAPPNQPYPSYSPAPPNQPYPSYSPAPPNQPYQSNSTPPNPPYQSHSPPPNPYTPDLSPPYMSPPNQPYPPNSQPQISDGPPAPYTAYSYPYAAPYSYPHGQPAYQYQYPYSQPNYPSQPHRPSSYSGPLPQTTAPTPSLQHNSSFHQQGSSHYQYPDSGVYQPSATQSQLHSRTNSLPGTPGQDNLSSAVSFNGEGNKLLYPPLDNLMADMRLNDNRLSAPASPPAPSLSKLDIVAMPYPGSGGNSPAPSFSKLDSYAMPYPGSGGNSPGHSASVSKLESYALAYPSGNSSSYGGFHGGHSRTHSWDGSSPAPPLAHYDSSAHLQLVPFHKGSLKVLLLHGNLDIWVYEAKNLPNMDLFHKTLGDVFCKLPGGVVSKIEGSVSRTITSDPYVSISVSNAVIGRTYVISNEENPVWMQHFNVPVAHYAAEVHFLVKDSDVVGSQLIGCVSIPVEEIYSGAKIEGTYPILNANGRQCKAGAVLVLSIQYIPIKNLSIYHHGVGAGPDYHGVLGTYFPLRRGGTVTLYQDAHVPDGCLPDITLENGRNYVHGKCWQDICDAICQAKRLVYITGWSVWHRVRLVRDNTASDCTLGELLRSKSAEGVRVLLLIWDDPTSRSILGYRTEGIMATHDEETRRYFKHSSVQVLLCPRIAGKRHSWYKQTEISTIYTHHQKTVLVDADAGNDKRKIIAFVGGLDLCDGRYDTPDHPIFKSLENEHKDDFHNPSFQGNTADCPREPWHDLHCRIDGPAAYDILTNFEERWMRAAKPHGIKKLKINYDDALLRIDRLPDIVGILEIPCLNEHDPEAWHVQVFRSIDSSSVKGFPKNPKEATSRNLVCGKNVLIDMSIHRAYVKAIRAAQHYIYIENQYFIGSSFNWSAHKDLGADNLIPMEIALKIADKIRNHERFAVYIVIPMWPEGIPSATATQRILYWQNKTMQMMYETIHKALVEVHLEDTYTPQDYLNFFCLGNREAFDGSQAAAGSTHPPNSPQALCIKNRRFMIYVHSKGMIVDDEYVILGSANINQRSMEGTRDTEIAMGAYQPHYTWARKGDCPRGQVYGYRMSLWAEHLGLVDDCFNKPESLECVRKVRTLSEMNWKNFAAETPTVMMGHLLKYPVDVDKRGKVKPLPGSESFPDLGGNICGSFNGITENLTI